MLNLKGSSLWHIPLVLITKSPMVDDVSELRVEQEEEKRENKMDALGGKEKREGRSKKWKEKGE